MRRKVMSFVVVEDAQKGTRILKIDFYPRKKIMN